MKETQEFTINNRQSLITKLFHVSISQVEYIKAYKILNAFMYDFCNSNKHNITI